MNLEEELNMLGTTTEETVGTTGVVSNELPQPQLATVSELQTAVAQPMMAQPTMQPAMVNPNVAQQSVDNFNLSISTVDLSKPLPGFNPLKKLTGQNGDTFRIHLLPGFQPTRVRIHWDQEKQHSFLCLTDAYGTEDGTEGCCITHGNPKIRYLIPVVVIPSQNGRVQVQPGVLLNGELKILILSGKQLETLKSQAEVLQTTLEQVDLIAQMQEAKYRTFNFTVDTTSFITQVSNVAQLQNEYQVNATEKNLIGVVGRLITRDVYKSAYSDYDYKKYITKDNSNANNTPTQAPVMYQQPGQYPQPQMYQQQVQPQMYQQMQPQQEPYGSNPLGY